MNKKRIQRLIIQEMFGLNMRFLLEADEPEETQPAASQPEPNTGMGTNPATGEGPTASGSPSPPPQAAPLPPPIAPEAQSTTPAPSQPSAPSPAPAQPILPAQPAQSVQQKQTPANVMSAIKDPVQKEIMKAAIKASGNGDVAVESLKKKKLSFLFEQEQKFDIGAFAGELARIIKNFTSIIDVKKHVIDSGKEYIKSNFPGESEELCQQLDDFLRKNFHIELEKQDPPEDEYAVGAREAGARGSGG